jgi:hypothetical protein
MDGGFLRDLAEVEVERIRDDARRLLAGDRLERSQVAVLAGWEVHLQFFARLALRGVSDEQGGQSLLAMGSGFPEPNGLFDQY